MKALKRRLAAALALSLGAGLTQAAPLRDPALQALAEAARWPELEQVALQRLAARADDGPAWLAYTEGVLARPGAGAPARREAALAKLETCVQKTPQVAACHYGVGAVTGVHILAQGLMKAAFGVGRVRDEFIQTLALDAAFSPARMGLVQFYLMAPGLAGGSVAKAKEIAKAEATRAPEYGKLLNAMILAYEEKPVEAERLLATVNVGTDAELADELRGQWAGLAFGHLQAQRPAPSREIFERLAKEKPADPQAHYGLGRALTDLQQWDAAITELKLAASLPGHEALPVDYRLGIALQGKGEKAQAKAAFQRYIASAEPQPKSLEDARKRLAELG